jgi:dTDP-4-dehydrorhamnose 3,5-epimerase
MKLTETNLKGCFVIEPPFFRDNRGSFLICFNHDEFQKQTGVQTNFVLDNQSISQYGVLRGLHMQKGEFAQAKLVRVTQGKVLDVVVDARKNSLTFGESFSIILSSDDNKQLFIPRGFLHGFVVLENNTIFSYKCDNYYNFDAEVGVMYNDTDLKIDWMLKEDEIILSEKDKKLMSFQEFQKEF